MFYPKIHAQTMLEILQGISKAEECLADDGARPILERTAK